MLTKDSFGQYQPVVRCLPLLIYIVSLIGVITYFFYLVLLLAFSPGPGFPTLSSRFCRLRALRLPLSIELPPLVSVFFSGPVVGLFGLVVPFLLLATAEFLGDEQQR